MRGEGATRFRERRAAGTLASLPAAVDVRPQNAKGREAFAPRPVARLSSGGYAAAGATFAALYVLAVVPHAILALGRLAPAGR